MKNPARHTWLSTTTYAADCNRITGYIQPLHWLYPATDRACHTSCNEGAGQPRAITSACALGGPQHKRGRRRGIDTLESSRFGAWRAANAHGRHSTHEWSPKVRQAIEPSQSSTACSDAQKHCRRIRRPVRRNRIQPSLCAPSPNELPSVASHIAHLRRQR